jgi:hypothetical protein
MRNSPNMGRKHHLLSALVDSIGTDQGIDMVLYI